VIGSVVLDQIDAMVPPIEGRQEHLVHKSQVGLPLEIVGLVQLRELSIVQANRAKYCWGVALAPGRPLRLHTPPGPGGVQGGSLPEGSFILEYDYRPFDGGVFFRFGSV
jgi:hypothetical protein